MSPEWSLDRPAPGLAVAQPRRGFRYGAEAFWVAGFALEGDMPRSAADLGTGSGVIALLLASCGVDAIGFELRNEWQAGWEITLARSEVLGRVRLVQADVGSLPAGAFDLVTANPPFFPAGRGPAARDPWRRAARTESTASLSGFVQAGTAILAPGGRLCLVVPRERDQEVGSVVRGVRIGARRTLLEVRPGAVPVTQYDEINEDHPRVLGWFQRFREPVQ